MKKEQHCTWDLVEKDDLYLLFIYGCIHLEIPSTQKEYSYYNNFLKKEWSILTVLLLREKMVKE